MNMKITCLSLCLAACAMCFAEAADVARPRVARWIAHPYGDGTLNWNDACDFMRPVRPSPVLRKRFALKESLAGGRLYVTGLGYFRFRFRPNGHVAVLVTF